MLFDRTEDLIFLNLKNVEPYGLGKRSALTGSDDVSFLDSEARAAVDRDISVSFFVTVILADVVEVVSSDDDGSVHFGGDDHTLEDSASDGDISGEGAFFVDVFSLDSFFGGFDAESDFFVVSDTFFGFGGSELFAV